MMPSSLNGKRHKSSDDETLRKRRKIEEDVSEAGPSTSRSKRKSRKDKGKGRATASEGSSSQGLGISSSSSVPTVVSSNPASPSSSTKNQRSMTLDEDTQLTEPAGVPPPPQTQLETDLQREVARLKQELATKNELLAQQQSTFESLQGMLTCQICLELMWDPYTTACGHTACVKCLQDWFKQPPPDNPLVAPGIPIAPQIRRKTCPTCRAIVHSRPTPLFTVRSILGAVSSSLDPEFVASSLPKGADALLRDLPIDPWYRIFPEDRPPAPEGAIVDEEDGVVRCPNCLYEVVEGICQGCGDMINELLVDEESDDNDHGGAVEIPRWMFGGGDDELSSDSDGESSRSSDSYEGSFIDDTLEFRAGDIIGGYSIALEGLREARRRRRDTSPDSEASLPPRRLVRRRVESQTEDNSDHDMSDNVSEDSTSSRRDRQELRTIAQIRAIERDIFGEDDFVDRQLTVSGPEDSESDVSEIVMARRRRPPRISDDDVRSLSPPIRRRARSVSVSDDGSEERALGMLGDASEGEGHSEHESEVSFPAVASGRYVRRRIVDSEDDSEEWSDEY